MQSKTMGLHWDSSDAFTEKLKLYVTRIDNKITSYICI